MVVAPDSPWTVTARPSVAPNTNAWVSPWQSMVVPAGPARAFSVIALPWNVRLV